MSAQLEDLIEREYKAQVQQAQLERETNQARFLALQSQVNPHFMFNALESIRMHSLLKKEMRRLIWSKNSPSCKDSMWSGEMML